ncbi:MAG: T9SS type A sorting domain-containing protein [bacterium]
MKKMYFIFGLLFLISFSVFALKSGDYRNATRIDTVGEWDEPNSWEQYDGSSWSTPATPPGPDNTVRITQENVYEMPTQVEVDSLIITHGFTFDAADSLTINGSLFVKNGAQIRYQGDAVGATGELSITVMEDVFIESDCKIDHGNTTPNGRFSVGGNLINDGVFKPYRYDHESVYDLIVGGSITGSSTTGIQNIDTVMLLSTGNINIEQDLFVNSIVYPNADTLNLGTNDLYMGKNNDTNNIVGNIMICDSLTLNPNDSRYGYSVQSDIVCNYLQMNNAGGIEKKVDLNGYDVTILDKFEDIGAQDYKFTIGGDTNSVITFGDGDLGNDLFMDMEFKDDLNLQKLVMNSETDTINFIDQTVVIDTLYIKAGWVTGTFTANTTIILDGDAGIASVDGASMSNDTIILSENVSVDSLINSVHLSNPEASFVVNDGTTDVTSGSLTEDHVVIVTSSNGMVDSTYEIKLLGVDATIASTSVGTLSNDSIYVTSSTTVEELIPAINLTDTNATFVVNDGTTDVTTGELTNSHRVIVTSEDGLNEKTYTIDVASPVGISNSTAQNVEVYPNPVSDLLIVEGVKESVKICDILGNVFKVLEKKGRVELSFDEYNNGLYLIIVDGITYKVVKR